MFFAQHFPHSPPDDHWFLKALVVWCIDLGCSVQKTNLSEAYLWNDNSVLAAIQTTPKPTVSLFAAHKIKTMSGWPLPDPLKWSLPVFVLVNAGECICPRRTESLPLLHFNAMWIWILEHWEMNAGNISKPSRGCSLQSKWVELNVQLPKSKSAFVMM